MRRFSRTRVCVQSARHARASALWARREERREEETCLLLCQGQRHSELGRTVARASHPIVWVTLVVSVEGCIILGDQELALCQDLVSQIAPPLVRRQRLPRVWCVCVFVVSGVCVFVVRTCVCDEDTDARGHRHKGTDTRWLRGHSHRGGVGQEERATKRCGEEQGPPWAGS